MVAQWLRANHYDGLCNPEAECGCGLDDLMPCQCVNECACVCAYRIAAPDGCDEYGDEWYCTSNSDQNEPSDTLENVAIDLFTWIDGVLNNNWCIELPGDLERYKTRLEALGVVL